MLIRILLFAVSMILISCSGAEKEKNKFINAYKELLTIRLMYPDTTIANPKVNKILAKNGFDKYSFAEQFKKYSSNPQEFRDMLDTARERAKKEYQILRKNNKSDEIPME